MQRLVRASARVAGDYAAGLRQQRFSHYAARLAEQGRWPNSWSHDGGAAARSADDACDWKQDRAGAYARYDLGRWQWLPAGASDRSGDHANHGRSIAAHRARFGREGLALIEEAIVSQPSAAMFALRARSAIAADRPEVLLESIAGYSQSLLNNISRLTPAELPMISGTLETLLRSLDELSRDARVRRSRIEQVRSSIAAVRDQIRSRAADSANR